MYDLAIIGTGPGGYEAIMTALRMGLKIAVIEKDKLGGNCLNRACIPTKYFRTGAHLVEKLSVTNEYGIVLGDYKLDYTKAWEGKEKAIGFLRRSLEQLLKAKKTPVYKGVGKIIDKNKIEITKSDGTKQTIEAKYILIATGSLPVNVGNIKIDGENVLSTEDYMDKLKQLPQKVLVVGGGVAGCELGYIMNRYGTQVFIVELMDRLLPSPIISTEISRYLHRKFKKLGIQTYLKTTLENYSILDTGIHCKLSNGEELTVDKILLSVGRKPNTDIDTIGIEKDERGFIKVNSYMQTNYENMYACGDVVNSPMLAHVASYEARLAVNNMFNEKKEKADYSLVPWAIFTAFEIAHIGLNEEQAKSQGIETVSGYYPYTYNEKAVDEHEPEGFVRLVFEKGSQEVIGASIVGIGASEIIHEIAFAIKDRYTAKDLHEFIYFHPSLSEIFIYATYDIVVGKLFR
ncbi:MAG: dihydrolipoyl dehydrogenase [Aquificae bacterium]|nr:dihydrolipoyl dehydrogenase [Aquificota bacterium]